MSPTGGRRFLQIPGPIAIIDVATAALLALTATLALYHRARTGEGQRSWASLAATAAYLQSGELVRYPGRPSATVGGRDFLGADRGSATTRSSTAGCVSRRFRRTP